VELLKTLKQSYECHCFNGSQDLYTDHFHNFVFIVMVVVVVLQLNFSFKSNNLTPDKNI